MVVVAANEATRAIRLELPKSRSSNCRLPRLWGLRSSVEFYKVFAVSLLLVNHDLNRIVTKRAARSVLASEILHDDRYVKELRDRVMYTFRVDNMPDGTSRGRTE